MTGRETVSVRKQKIRRNRIKARLLFFLLLVVALLLVVVFAAVLVGVLLFGADLPL